MPPVEALTEGMTSIRIDDEEHPVTEIRATGDVILDVFFENTSSCNKSIPSDTIRQMRASKSPIPSVRAFYRVRLETLKKHSQYFQHLLGPHFAEGAVIRDSFTRLAETNRHPTEIAAEALPRIKIVDEDAPTKTLGRQAIFRDMLRIIHGADHLTKPITTNCLTVLAIMADRYNTLPTITRYVQKNFASFKYPATVDKSTEEILRQKILIFFHTDQTMRFAATTRELILRGSSRWNEVEDANADFQTAWWDLPQGLEAELAHRRACVLRTIASIQTQFLTIYSSRDRQCKLGYDSSSSCDSFQLGEMVKFLTKKGLLSLVPFQATSPEDADYIWPYAYNGDIENLIGILRQCPSYQIDKNHTHCGLRTKLLPAVDYIKGCIDTGVGVRLQAFKTGDPAEAWIPRKGHQQKKKPFFVVGEDVAEPTSAFSFASARNGDRWNMSSNAEKARTLFLAQQWDWVTEPGEQPVSSAWQRLTYKAIA